MNYRPHMKLFLLLAFLATLTSCGGGELTIDESQYIPKIVVEGYLYPGDSVNNIRITRNFWVEEDVFDFPLILNNADVQLTDLQTNQVFDLTYSENNFAFNYNGPGLSIGYGQSYRLDVSAEVDGEMLQTNSTTTLPLPGFSIINFNHDALVYRQRDASDELMRFEAILNRSPGTTFYALSLVSLAADSIDVYTWSDERIEAAIERTFIWDNPFFDFEMEDIRLDFDEFRYRFGWIQDTPTVAGQSNFELFWFDTWFYGSYRAIFYAADKNYKEFLQTYSEVQEMDGNYHEPAFNFEGDGIGVFGSVIADTVYFDVLRPE